MEIYSGQENEKRFRRNDEPDFDACANIVIRLTHDVPTFCNHRLYFDNYYFSTIPLIVFLRKERGIFSLGTMRQNHTANCPLWKGKKLKRLKRGDCIERLGVWKGTPVTVIQWMDNKPILLASSFAGKFLLDVARRWVKQSGTYIEVSQPYAVSKYNKFMGGVDLTGSYIGRNRIKMKSWKWYMRMFHHFIDVVISNCWLIFKDKHPEIKMSSSKFREELAYSLLKHGKKTSKRGRPALNAPLPKVKRQIIPSVDV